MIFHLCGKTAMLDASGWSTHFPTLICYGFGLFGMAVLCTIAAHGEDQIRLRALLVQVKNLDEE